MSGDPRFLVDAMLGRLAKWLRILGFDAEYAGGLSDEGLVEKASVGGLILLTRDTGILKRRALRRGWVSFIFIDDDRVSNQITQVFEALSLSRRRPRCVECNEMLVEVDKESIRPKVPPYVFETQNRFVRCPKCARVFWDGTQWAEVERTAAALLKKGSVK